MEPNLAPDSPDSSHLSSIERIRLREEGKKFAKRCRKYEVLFAHFEQMEEG